MDELAWFVIGPGMDAFFWIFGFLCIRGGIGEGDCSITWVGGEMCCYLLSLVLQFLMSFESGGVMDMGWLELWMVFVGSHLRGQKGRFF